jgi:hypothetical protein
MRITLNALMGKARPEPIGDGFALWSPAEITVTDYEPVSYDIRMLLKVEHRHIVITELTVKQRKGGPPVNGTDLRNVPVQRILESVFSDSMLRIVIDEKGNHIASPVDFTDDPDTVVAAIYRLAVALEYPPVRAVAEGLDLSPSTARGRISATRAKGLLSETEKGKVSR